MNNSSKDTDVITESINTIDCIFDIQGKYTVLIRRDHEPFKDYWALPGGRMLYLETLEDAVVREMGEETGIAIERVASDRHDKVCVLGAYSNLEQVHTYGPGNDPRGGNTTVYAISLDIDPESVRAALRKGSDAKDIGVFRLDKIPQLAFDHNQFIHDYHKRFKKYRNPIPTTDILIEYDDGEKEGLVLIERNNPPYGIAIPGGFAELGLSYEQNAAKESKEETNLDIEILNPQRPWVYSSPDRDPRGHMVSNTFLAKGHGRLEGGDDAKNARLYTIPELIYLVTCKPERLAFDHADIITDYLAYTGYDHKK